ncbi:DUF1971 domain-containing protein [Aureimonas fodinaquatilis]|uniref:DUF1971 domain-containing protein n=1 Tax=Aureimonas fodinaquatilis TaxID=2565783 RepID=A0A5B0DRP7_9HYPH|nr:DUF1971 domain-containing protein [Aureimonas fodinaquatilis]KAA0969043.1 DUF1971 domain-containing protein [Aureimonas fodinaquatilis]
MSAIPDDAVAYRRSPVFNQDSLPTALQKQHSTKEGAWAMIHILEGRLLYRICEPPSETVLDPDHPGIVQPQQLHEVQVIGPVRMFVEFYSRP